MSPIALADIQGLSLETKHEEEEEEEEEEEGVAADAKKKKKKKSEHAFRLPSLTPQARRKRPT